MKRKLWAANFGNCIHVAGILRFLQLAEECHYQTTYAGVGYTPEKVVAAIKTAKPEIVALSYRLSPETVVHLFQELKTVLEREKITGITWIFGGTPPVCQIARESGIFSAVFSGLEDDSQVIRYLNGETEAGQVKQEWAQSLVARIQEQAPYPLLRHHFGLPDLEVTVAGIEKIAAAGVLDVISIGPDQNAQEFFFRPEEMNPANNGAGGVPLRQVEDLRRLYQASRSGNYPLLRIYSGTQDLIKWAELSVQELNNAWAAIPLYWYSVLDGRSQLGIEAAILEHQATMQWYAKRGIPVEVNEAHHWSLRGAPDEIAVVAACLAAYNAKAQGVHDFILQLMWNNPPQILPYQDLAKMLAKLELVEELVGDDFHVWREVRAGLASLSPHLDLAKGQLSASTMLSLQVKPQIIHVVGYCEADHAATAEEVIESCQIVRGVLQQRLVGMPDMKQDKMVQARKEELLVKARQIIKQIKALGGGENALTNPEILALAVRRKIMNAPQIVGVNPSLVQSQLG